jgi:hypothetical protein
MRPEGISISLSIKKLLVYQIGGVIPCGPTVVSKPS